MIIFEIKESLKEVLFRNKTYRIELRLGIAAAVVNN